MLARQKYHIRAGDDLDVRNAKKVGKDTWLFDVVEAPGNSRTIAIPTNESRRLSTYKYSKSVNAKLRSHISRCI